jgi:outer membrane protein TolC
MNRPEIKISTLTVEYNKYEKRIARAKGWPKIDGMGSWGLAKELYIAEDNQPTWDATNGVWNYNPYRKLGPQWYWGIKASMPIGGSTFEYSVTRERWVPVVSAYHGTQATTNTMKLNLLDKVGYYSDIADAEVGYWRSEQELQKAVQDVTLEVKEGVYGLEKSKLQLATSESKVKYQAQDLELTKFKRGMDEVQDSVVVESMIKLGQEKFGYAQAVADYHIAIATLDKAMGIENYLSAEGDISKR